MNTYTVTLPSGEKKEVKIQLFSAMEGWTMQQRFIEFASSNDEALRREYTLDVLAFSKVVLDGTDIPLTTDALIDNHLRHWLVVKDLFEEILRRNGINPETHADKPDYWADAGARMAVSFIAEAAKLMGPAFSTFDKVVKQEA